MLKPITAMTLKLFYLGLIVFAHLGVLSLTFGDNWIKQLFLISRTELVNSVLILVIVYALSFYGFRKRHTILYDVWLYSPAIIGLALLTYQIFSENIENAKIYASTLVAVYVIYITVLGEIYQNKIWKMSRRIVIAGLLAVNLSILYSHQYLIRGFLHSFNIATLAEIKAQKEEKVLHTSFHAIQKTVYSLTDYYIPQKISNIPSHIDAIDNKRFLLIDRFGNMYDLALQGQTEEDLYIKKLNATFPINYQELYSSAEGKKITKGFFRVNDLYIDMENGKKALYVSHHHWNGENKCFTLRISKLDSISILFEEESSPQWRLLYETAPCFSVTEKGSFDGHQAGGRIVGMDEDHILLSVGDHSFDSLQSKENFPQDLNAAYGKILKVNRQTGAAEIFSLGHRNPQGLYRDRDGSIWETEHGPASGDELNKIELGKNYGWPFVLYGTDYGAKTWAPNKKQNNHDGYEQPVFAWNPSIGVSNLIRIEQDLFPAWKHNLLVGSLKKEGAGIDNGFRLYVFACARVG